MSYKFLDSITGPEDIRSLGPEELKELCSEIRQEIIKVISKNGGHLAASLGTVELTVALHYVFHAPEDRIIWDVGHQTYAHKLLTGRRDRFATIRSQGGLSGFPKIEESPYDAFGTGHASTSISAALGLACARDHQGQKHRVVAVIGDGSLTGGLAFEGLNHAGQLKKNMLVVLNDNSMAISKRVGAMGQYLTKITTTQTYTGLEKKIWDLLGRLPQDVGQPSRVLLRRLREGFKNLIVPGLTFEELGYHYEGPVDGHDIGALIDILQRVRDLPGPTLLHVLTVKGKGFEPAEHDAEKFHGVGAFDPETGDAIDCGSHCTFTQIFGETLVELARSDGRIVAVTAAMPEGTGLDLFRRQFPDRFYDVGIAEQHALTFSAGLAREGMRPVAAIYSTFLQRGFDQIIHDIALQKLPVVIALDRAGVVGEDGPTHHGVFDLSYLRLIPNLVIMAPRDEQELRSMLRTALSSDLPVAIRYPRGAGFGLEPREPEILPWGKAEVLERGRQVAVIAIGVMATLAQRAAAKLRTQGLRPEVINARFCRPLDVELYLEVFKKFKRVVTIEENVLAGGFGSAIDELAQEAGASCRILRLGLPNTFIPQGKRRDLLRGYGLDEEGIAKSIYEFLKG